MLVIIMIGTKATVYIQPSELPSVPVSCRWNNSMTVLACHPSYLLVILCDILEALFMGRNPINQENEVHRLDATTMVHHAVSYLDSSQA